MQLYRQKNLTVFFCSYAEAVLASTEGFQEKLTKEMSDFIDKHCDDESVPEVSQSNKVMYMYLINVNGSTQPIEL